jgi:glycine/D-amino acid oxidase-like deaminating enzyme
MMAVGMGGQIRETELHQYPWWWEGTDLAAAGEDAVAALPKRVDVAIVGGGLTGLSAAQTLAAAGRSVLVLDAGRPGAGASSRNGAMLGRYFKHSFGQMKESAGLDTAVAYFRELCEVYEFAVKRIGALGVDSGFRNCGRVVGAITPAHRERLFREWDLRAKHVGEAVDFLEENHAELPTQRYVGGVHIVENAAVHPGRYSMANVHAARAAGADIVGNTTVLHVTRERDGFVVATPRGEVQARDVLIATNGYTAKSHGWFFRRLSPIDAFMVATAPIAPEKLHRLRAGNRTYHDNRKNSNYYQLSEDGRLIFGGRTGLFHRSLPQMAGKLREDIAHFFPEIVDVEITHAWTGRCAATGDMFPHVGRHDGMHFALGYCFSGLAMAPYLGHKAALRMLGEEDAARTLFTQDSLQHVAWPKRQTFLIPLAMHYYRMREPLVK